MATASTARGYAVAAPDVRLTEAVNYLGIFLRYARAVDNDVGPEEPARRRTQGEESGLLVGV